MTKQLSVLARRARSGYMKTQGGRTAWLEGTFTLARALRSARKQLPADRAFAAWLVKAGLRGLAKDDRAALLVISTNVREARAFLKERESVSWRACAQSIRTMASIKPATVSVSQIAKPKRLALTIEYAASTAPAAMSMATKPIGMQEQPPHLRLVSSGVSPVTLQQTASAVMTFIPATLPVTSDALAAYWRRERINQRPSSEQIRHAARWLWTLADALKASERRAEPGDPIDDGA